MYERFTRLCATALLALGLGACERPDPVVEPGVAQSLAQARAEVLSAVAYRIALRVPADAGTAITGDMRIEFELAEVREPLQLDFREKADKLLAVMVNDAPSNYRFDAEHLVIPAAELERGANRIDIRFEAGDSSLNRNPDYLYTLFVPDRARTAFPLFDQPDIKATWELSLELPAQWTALANAPLASERRDGKRRQMQFARTAPLSSYLFAFVAGRFERVTREVDGREIVLLHREPDAARLARNLDAIFELHGAALAWLEDYTAIDYPFAQFGLALVPAFQYGGMEHVGNILYRADSLLLDEAPSDEELLGRASLIAHETAHMWFGDLVTMRWFDDVWTKEVFANFMAAKIVNPGFPDIDHALNFLVRHYPGAYSVDRTAGANPIRQPLPNLNQAGQLYGDIIYDKAPIMMRQLEDILGAEALRDGLREYLREYAFGNATWPALIAILDRRSERDLAAWSEVWVNSAGRPQFQLERDARGAQLLQVDPDGRGRSWPQSFTLLSMGDGSFTTQALTVDGPRTALQPPLPAAPGELLFNADGRGYGLFPASADSLRHWASLEPLARGSLLVNLYEQLLTGAGPTPTRYFKALGELIAREDNQLVLGLALSQLRRIYWTLLPENEREASAAALEHTLWQSMLARDEPGLRKLYFDSFADIAQTPEALLRLQDVWSGERQIEGLPLSERYRIKLAQWLAIKLPRQSAAIIAAQLAHTENPDETRRLQFLADSLSPDPAVRDAFFASLAGEEMRTTESWVLDALANLHHPLRVAESEKYIRASLDLLAEIQATGDIFFPKRWLDATLANHHSATAAATVTAFLEAHPDYNRQLRLKILQSADPLWRAQRLRATPQP
ncbi:peptidase M1 [Mangrovimicrobium sediminis]|uniref:Aminopeptidase N n=1 Tax=Mangrovimicrobium sediminis TaxID=2562682 RepID=A0A4Z0M613_9GAMM|nr:M1 family aminopeptidase [Haliea sp. SAOS-164]TGD74850.1 peptidase M1 [Haliea sp. SAOS-164]